MTFTHEIRQLRRSLGTIDGLNQINAEIDRLRLAMVENRTAITSQELKEIKAALDGLSAAILEMRQATRSILAESGAVFSYVG